MISRDYLAGFIDGEGCIGIYRHNKKNRKHGTWVGRITLVNTDLEILLKIKEEFGGFVQQKRKTCGWKQSYSLTFEGSALDALIDILSERLVVKKEQLGVLKQLREVVKVRIGELHGEDVLVRECLRKKISKLNCRGD